MNLIPDDAAIGNKAAKYTSLATKMLRITWIGEHMAAMLGTYINVQSPLSSALLPVH